MELFLGSGSETQARLRLPKNVAEAQHMYREDFAERLYDGLFATYENG